MLTFTLITVFITSITCLETVPDYIHVCRASDPDLAQCMVDSIEFLQPLLANGIPEMNVPSIEPLELGDLLVSEKTKARSGLRISANNIKAYNASMFKVHNMKVVQFARVYTFDVKFKTMFVTGDYVMDGQILVLPITGSGKFTATFVNALGKNRVTFEEVDRDGVTYVHMKKVETKITLEDGSINLQNLFNGDRLLGDTVNDAINQNFVAVSGDIIPLVERALNKVFKKIGNRICSRFTVEQLFPRS